MSLLNRKAVRDLALSDAKRRFEKVTEYQFVRVSEDFFTRIEAAVRAAVRREVYDAPSKGKTLL